MSYIHWDGSVHPSDPAQAERPAPAAGLAVTHDELQSIKRTALDAMPGEVNKALSSIVRQCIDLQKRLSALASQAKRPAQEPLP